MKKILLGLAVAATYGLYSLGIRHHNPTISKPSSLSTPATSTTNNSNSNQSSNPPSSSPQAKSFADGTYTGAIADAFYGNVQVSVTISNGQISDVKFLQYPDTHSTSVLINQQAMPFLKQETIQAQSANVQIISGATFTSQAFIQSLSSALAKA